MGSEKEKLYLVSAKILPEALLKTAEAKELLVIGEAKTINEAVERVDLSRSVFYKYRDGIFEYNRVANNSVVTVGLLLQNRAGILSAILNAVAAEQGNVLTINQNLPLQGIAWVTLSIDTSAMMISIERLLKTLSLIKGVTNIDLIGHS